MAKVQLDQLRQRIEANNQRRLQYEEKSRQANGLRRHEMWRHTYLSRTYLTGTPDEHVASVSETSS